MDWYCKIVLRFTIIDFIFPNRCSNAFLVEINGDDIKYQAKLFSEAFPKLPLKEFQVLATDRHPCK